MEATLKNLSKVGVRIADPRDLTLLNANPDDPLIDVMATASALFESELSDSSMHYDILTIDISRSPALLGLCTPGRVSRAGQRIP